MSILESNRLPTFRFLKADGGEDRLDLASSGARINALADVLRADFPAGTNVGLIYRTGPDLVLLWLATLVAGLRPLILQYPTSRQSRIYWEDSVTKTLTTARLGGLLCEDRVAARLADVDLSVPVLTSRHLASEEGARSSFALSDFSILQLSSGTTGHRKAVEFTSHGLVAHAEDYASVMRYGPQDVIVSWLPLYHDMGYIACFMIPLLLGIECVLIDPEDWVNDKTLLWRAIARHRGTICYMPNFGFEVMSTVPLGSDPGILGQMRMWVSCSEPTRERSIRKFLEATGVAEDRFHSCYAMAENIFAVTQKEGLGVRRIDEADVVSCGTPIANVDIRIVDGEIFVRSRSSIANYMYGDRIADDEGYYPTGDLGQIIDGELYVTGRKRDLFIQAGKKFLLSDIDAVVNEVLAGARGRLATFAVTDERLGTQKPVVLVEAADFYRQTDVLPISEAIRARTGLDHIDIAFVPPRFITKTSSGKVNRVQTAAHWQALATEGSRIKGRTLAQEVNAEFGRFDQTVPVRGLLDSLSLTVLTMICADHGVELKGDETLQDIVARSQTGQAGQQERVINIVSLADRKIISRLRPEHLDALGKRLGARVRVEHVCLPPTPVLLSDMVFCRYFYPRVTNKEDYSSVIATYEKLSQASLILIDDAAELGFCATQIYPVLSHRLEREAEADLISVRWQRYADQHHKLPVGVVEGSKLSAEERGRTIEALAAFLGVPICRIATVKSLSRFTMDWDIRLLQSESVGPGLLPIRPDKFVNEIGNYVARLPEPLRQVALPAGASRLVLNDLPHFCSHLLRQNAIDEIVQHFGSFCIAGRPASVPYVAKALERSGKPFAYVSSMTRESLAHAPDHDCLLITGAMGRYEWDRPSVTLMGTRDRQATRGLPGEHPLHGIAVRQYRGARGFSEWYNLLDGLPGLSEEDTAMLRDAIRKARAVRGVERD